MSAVEERLVDAAAGLFYRRGIAATGVDAVATESGVSKPTLYARFGTKDALVVAVLNDRHRRRRASLEEHLRVRAALSPVERMLSVFEWVATQQRDDGARGCPFVNASVELGRPQDGPAREVVGRHKRWFRGILADLAAEAGAAEPVILASQVHLLIEGANARILAEADLTAVDDARRAARLLVEVACPDTGTARAGARTGGTEQ